MRYLAFDLGASSGKMFVGHFDGERLTVKPIHNFKNGVVAMGNGLYWDFPGIWSNLCLGIQKAAQDHAITSLGIDSFNNDFSFIDEAGEMLFPVRSYRDARTIKHEKAIYGKIPREPLYMLSGNQLAPFNTYMQLAAMVENKQNYLFEHVKNLMMLPDLLGFYLTGNRVIEYTLAAETQMLDMRTKQWIPATLNALNFPESLLPPLQMPGTVLGKVSPEVCSALGISTFDCVNVCQHDTASAFLSAPMSEPSAIISGGTWSIVGIEVEQPYISEYGYAHNIANEGGFPGHHRLLKNVMGSWILQELIRDFALDGLTFDYVQIQKLALNAPAFSHMIDVDDQRFYSPGNMREKIRRACMETTGRAPETPGEYLRTVYEGLSFKYRQALSELETLTQNAYHRVHIIGGGSQDALACQFSANALSRTVIAGPIDGTAIGNILVQMIAHGEIDSIEQGRELIRRSQPLREYVPEDAAQWADQYDKFAQLFSS